MSLILFLSLSAIGMFFSVAYLAERERALAWLVRLVLAAAGLLALVTGLPYAMVGALPGAADTAAEVVAGTGFSLSEAGLAGLVEAMPWFGWLSVGVGLAALAVLVRPVRALIARALPIDPDRLVHTTALSMAVYVVGTSGALAIFLPVIAGDEGALESLAGTSAGVGLAPLWAQSLGFVVMAALGVGLGVSRNGRETLERLGLTLRLDWRWWLAGTVLALAFGVAIDWLWAIVDSQSLAEVTRISEALFRPYLGFGLAGALTIGLSAGLGEEILFRGAAQPRLGLITTSLLFAVVHTQYTVSLALVQVFLVGLVLGLTRKRANTTTAIATHATYNLVLALLAIYAPNLAP